jgi:protein-glutamine gamma-glutamyltransferase
MNQHRRFMHVTLLVVLLAITGYCVAAGDAVLFVLALPAAITAWWARTKPWAVHIPRLLLNLTLLVSMLFVAWLTTRQGVKLERVAELMVVLTVIKCFDRQSARDYMELYTLSLFLVIGAVMTSVRLELGLVLLAFMPAAVVGVMLLQVFTAHERVAASTSKGAPGFAHRPMPRLARGEHSSAQFRLTATTVLVGGSAVAIAVFVLVPRGMGENILGTAVGSSRGMTTGFTGEVQLGRAGLISESTTPVLHMEVVDEFGQNLGGSSVVYYLRGNVLDRYNAETKTWTRDENTNDSRRSQVEPNTWRLLSATQGKGIRQIITLLAGNEESNYLFAVYRPTRIKFDRSVRIERQSDDRILVLDHTGELKYEVDSNIQPTLARNRRNNNPVFFNSDVVRSFAESVLEAADVERAASLRDAQADRKAALAIRDFLHREFLYTTDIQAPADSQDPIEWFLSDNREGHCEYFASAMAAMCRSIGIDARVVTGYVAVEYNEMTSQYIVRESNAHAWVEVRDRGGAYRTYDPTPPDDLRSIHAAKRGLRARLRSLLDMMEHLWVSRVVTFDSGMRDTLIRDSQGLESTLSSSTQKLLSKTRLGGLSLALQAALVGTVVFTFVVAMSVLMRHLLRRVHRKDRRAKAGAAQSDISSQPWLDRTEFYHQLLDALQGLGYAKPLSRPPLAHIEAIQATDPALADGAQPLVSLYYRARFGHRPISTDEQSAAAAALSVLTQRAPPDPDPSTDHPPAQT